MSTETSEKALLHTIATIEEQERHLVLSRFDNEDAWRLGCTIVEMARERDLGITIDIRRGTQQLFHAALPVHRPTTMTGWHARSASWNGSAHRPTSSGLRSAAKGAPFSVRRDDLPPHLSQGGGQLPHPHSGVGVVGAVTVSGLAQEDAHDLVVEALRAFLG